MLEFDFSNIEKKILSLYAWFENEIPSLAAKIIKEDIIERTKRGEDANGAIFIPYTPRYARKFRDRYGLQISPPNLWALDDPHLLESIFFTSDHTLWFPDNKVAIAQGNQEKWGRFFFGVNEDTFKKVHDSLQPILQSLLL